MRPQELEANAKDIEQKVHRLRKGFICDTEGRGYETPGGDPRIQIVLEASEGFIPLWKENTMLRWRFRDRSMFHLPDPEATRAKVRNLLGAALLAWGDFIPVRFTEDKDVWDFEIVMKSADECGNGGCVLASAFFPDAGRHEFVVYPMMFEQSPEDQIETFAHELGHVFGLRHFFAQLKEKPWPSVNFGEQNELSIMNYDELCELTAADQSDLKLLYLSVWSGKLTKINGTPIRLVSPFHTIHSIPTTIAIAQFAQQE